MKINIEPNNGIPIYEQLVRQVKYSVAEGVLVPGQVIPSVREMAKLLTLNPNTVQRAYLQLQDEKVLQSLRGRGMAVADEALKRCVSDRQELLAQRLLAVLQEAFQSGLEEPNVREMFENALVVIKEKQASVSADSSLPKLSGTNETKLNSGEGQ